MTPAEGQSQISRRLAERIVAAGATIPPRPPLDVADLDFDADIDAHGTWRSRFFWKLYYGYVALILATTAAVGLIVAYQLEKNERSLLQGRLMDQAKTVQSFLAGGAAPAEGTVAIPIQLVVIRLVPYSTE